MLEDQNTTRHPVGVHSQSWNLFRASFSASAFRQCHYEVQSQQKLGNTGGMISCSTFLCSLMFPHKGKITKLGLQQISVLLIATQKYMVCFGTFQLFTFFLLWHFFKIYIKAFIIFRSKCMTSNLFNYVFRYVNSSVPIPTHYFVVLTSCKNKSYTPDTCPGWLDVLSFVIPHRPTNMESCPVSMQRESPWDLREQSVRAHLDSHKSGSDYSIFCQVFLGGGV